MIRAGDKVVFRIDDGHHEPVMVTVITLTENDRADVRLPGGGVLGVPLSMLSVGTVRRVNGRT
jgi:hypothetical protein